MAAQQSGVPPLTGSKTEKIKQLYYRQDPRTESLYLGIGYFMRMRFFTVFESDKFYVKITTASTVKDYNDIYGYIMDLMTAYIHNREREVSMENINCMICNRDMIKANYEHYPERLVEKLKRCLMRERELLKSDFASSETGQTGPFSLSTPSENIMTDTVEEEEFTEFQAKDIIPDYQEPDFSIDTIHDKYFYSIEIDIEYGNFEHVASQINGLDIMNRPAELQQKYEASTKQMLQLLAEGLEKLKNIKTRFLCHQAQMEVGLLPEKNILYHLTTVFDAYARVLRKFHNSFDGCLNCPPSELDPLIVEYMNLALIVHTHPEGYTFIENVKKEDSKMEGKGKKTKEEKSKPPKVYSTKKNSGITTELQMLGNQKLDCGIPSFELRSYSLMLVTEEGQKAGELSYQDGCKLENSKIKFADVKVHGHQRESSKNTRCQFLRLVYTVNMFGFGQEFQLQIKSLPFNLVTGSLQALEFTGTRLWYFYCNLDNMYSNCHMDEEFDKVRFLGMLDRIVSAFSSRKLSFNDKEFLWNQIPANKGKTAQVRRVVSEQAFSKTPIGQTFEMEKKREFSFYTWFYALVNTVKTCLRKHWEDGLIYGMLTKKEAEQVLYADGIPPGTALIRPMRSTVLNPNCKNALLMMALELKVRVGDEDKVIVVDMSAEEISKQGLYDKLERISVQTTNTTASNNNNNCMTIQRVLKAENVKGNKFITMNELFDNYSGQNDNFKKGYHNCLVAKMDNLVVDVSKNETHTPSSAKSARHYNDVTDSHLHLQSRRRRTASSASSSSSVTSPHASSSGFSQGSMEVTSGGRNTEAWSPNASDVTSPASMEHDEGFGSTQGSPPTPASHLTCLSPAQSPMWERFGSNQVDTSILQKNLLTGGVSTSKDTICNSGNGNVIPQQINNTFAQSATNSIPFQTDNLNVSSCGPNTSFGITPIPNNSNDKVFIQQTTAPNMTSNSNTLLSPNESMAHDQQTTAASAHALYNGMTTASRSGVNTSAAGTVPTGNGFVYNQSQHVLFPVGSSVIQEEVIKDEMADQDALRCLITADGDVMLNNGNEPDLDESMKDWLINNVPHRSDNASVPTIFEQLQQK